MRKLSIVITFVSTVMAGQLALAHHSRSNFANTKIEITGIVTNYQWRNPHAYFDVEVRDENGETVTWTVETHGTPILARRGWSRDSLRPGEEITVSGSPDRNPDRKFIFGDWTRKADGTTLLINGPGPAPEAVAVRVTADRPDFTGVYAYIRPPGQEISNINRDVAAPGYPLTPKAQAVANQFDPGAIAAGACVPQPLPSLYAAPYLLEFKQDGLGRFVIHHEIDNQVRTIDMGGSMPAASNFGYLGYSIGRWEGNELVIETARFRAHPEGIDRGIPSGTEKKVEERISLNEAGVVRVVATVTDPEHLTEPVVRTYDMRRINAELVDYDCELDVARRYRQGPQ